MMKEFTFTKSIMKLAVLGITEPQYKILLALNLKRIMDKDTFGSMKELAQHLKLSLPLLAYHIKGNKESLGLVRLGLVTSKPNCVTRRGLGNTIEITSLGILMLEERLRSAKLILRKEIIRGY